MIHILDEKTIQENYIKFRKFINQSFTGERLDRLNEMYDHLEDRIILTPASSFSHFHNAFAGGYIDHILRVTRNAIKFYEMYTELGINTSNYTKENVVFCALHHDLGKVGNETDNWYIPNESKWHVENQGKIYETNPQMHWMNLNDRTIYMLNHFGIRISEEELIGIKLTDGLFDENNKEYYMQFKASASLKITLPIVLHHADVIAARYEKERWEGIKNPNKKKDVNKNIGGRPNKSQKLKDIKMPEKVDFKSIFGDVTE
jgi:hypothetical protein